MEEIIGHIDIETLHGSSSQDSHVNDYLFVTDRLENVLMGNRAIQMEVFLMIYCIEGEVKLELNNEPRHLKSDDLLVGLPNSIVGEVWASPEYRVKVLCFSGRFIQRLTQTEKNTWKSMNYLRRNTVKHLAGGERALFNQYLNLIETKSNDETDANRKEILLYLSSAFFVEFLGKTNQEMLESEGNGRRHINQPDFIFKRFMETLTSDNGKHRTLEYYADLFCYSPKYLSRIIKRISGKNALTLIHENAIEHIIWELKYSSKSIKEIAAEFDFSNVSFFAQYIKKHLGVTPSEYRSNGGVSKN